MTLNDIQREAEQLAPEEQKKLIGFLVQMNLRRDEGRLAEIARRIEDHSPNAWMSLRQAEERFKADGV